MCFVDVLLMAKHMKQPMQNALTILLRSALLIVMKLSHFNKKWQILIFAIFTSLKRPG
jgi:hypothetical protein